MAATVQQHCATNTNTPTRGTNTASNPNPKLKRLVYSKYRELLGSYNDQANAYIETLPSYMVHKDTGFNLNTTTNSDFIINSSVHNGNATDNHQKEMYGAGQRMPAQQTYEAPACVQNAMMTKDKKPFTYTPGGIDLSQIKSERMAKRLARNAQAEGATGVQQQNRPTQPQSPGGSIQSMGAAAMGMPFQVLPPPPPPSPGKNFNGGSAPAPPPPPSSSNFSNTGTLAPPSNGNGAGGRGSAPNSPSMPRKSPTPQRFEPPPMGFRPEIKIPPNPMAALRKVPPPVEKNTFWKDEYVKDRSKSPMVDLPNSSNSNHDSVHSASSSPQTMIANNNSTETLNNDNVDGTKKTMPNTTTNNTMQQNQTNNNYTNYPQPQAYTPPSPHQQLQQSPIKPLQQSPQYDASQPPTTPQQQTESSQYSPQQQQQQSTKPEFRSVAAPTSPAVNVYTRQSDSPRTVENANPPRATESPFKFSQQQQQQHQRAPSAVSPLAQHSTPSSASSGVSVSPNNQAQTVPWRTQRGQSQQPQQPQSSAVGQSHPQPIYNNVQQQQQRTPDFSTQQLSYQGPKPTNVGSLYIAPLAPPTDPQSQNIVRQQVQQQQPNQQLRWMSTQPMAKEQPAWARPEENGNVVPSSLNRIKSPPPPSSSPIQVQQQMHQPLNQGNGFMTQTIGQNFGAHQPINTTTGLRLQINTPVNQTNSQNGPKERIIPIQLEQTPTYSAAQPNFNQQQQHGAGSISPAPGYVMRTPNQFVDQGYNNFGQQQQPLRVTSPNLQQLNAPRMVQQTQNNVAPGNKTHIIPITIENNEGTRGPISKTPIVIQNDQRTPPVQSKSFRILQKITDTTDDGSNDDNASQQPQQHLQQQPIEPQLHRPTFARQMSAQQAHHSPTIEQMRRMQIGHEQGNYSAPTTPSAIIYNQQRPFYDNAQKYVPPSEQQAPEPKKYTGSAIPSRSFKILQAMTQPENADKQENCQKNCENEMNEIESRPDSSRHSSYDHSTSAVQPASSTSSTSINSELAFSSSSSSCSSTPPPSQAIPYPPYPYPYGYPWYLPPPSHMPSAQSSENYTPPNWHYPYGPPPTPPTLSAIGDQPTHYPPFPYYYPYYPPTPPPPHMPPHNCSQTPTNPQTTAFDSQTMYPSYMPLPHPYLAYPYPVAPSYSQGSSSSRSSSVLPDIIITPSTDDVPSKVIMKHHIKLETEPPKKAGSIEIEDVTSLKSSAPANGSVVDILTQQLENMTKCIKNNLNKQYQTKKVYEKNIEQKSPEDNRSPVQISMLMTDSERDSDQTSSDSEITPKQIDKKAPIPLKSIKSVNNIQIYNGQKLQEMEAEFDSATDSEGDDDDETTADGESDIFDEDNEEEQNSNHHDLESEHDSESEEFVVDDGLSVIYEEESEMEKSTGLSKAATQVDRSQLEIEENDDGDEEERDDSTSVTVRLPLKFSFSTSEDAENITTVEVGKSQVEQQRNSVTSSEKRNLFNVASTKSDSEDDASSEYDDCDVSVAISLTHSSISSSLDAEAENKNKVDKYPIEDMPLPEDTLEKIESSQEDISVSFSLNMRNKFANETSTGNITNNIAMLKDDVIETGNEEVKTSIEAPDEMDFFATLMATKMQAQKIKEQSASYWGKSPEKPSDEPEIQTDSKESSSKHKKHLKDTIDSKEIRFECRKKSSNNLTTETNIKKRTEDSKDTQRRKNISAEQNISIPEASSTCCGNGIETETKETINSCSKLSDKSMKPKFSFWDRCSSASKDDKVLETNSWEKCSSPKERKQQTVEEGDKTMAAEVVSSSLDSRDKYFSSKETDSTAVAKETEEIEDIWADRKEDLPPIKPIKIKSLETARNSFWASVYECDKPPTKINTERPLKEVETINKVDFTMSALRSAVMEVSQPQRASCHYEDVEESKPAALEQEEDEEIDFWAEIEKARASKTPEPASVLNDSLYAPSYGVQDMRTDGSTLINSFGEQETSMFNDDNMMAAAQEFDPLKYPEEPREVDTDEEIDFWAEIEAKRLGEAEDDVNFQKSASFWASRERQNSVDETPYKPVLPKAFHAKLPDEPPTDNINIWAALEAHKGEEPLIIDPEMEEERLLIQEYDNMTQQEISEDEQHDESVSVHEPIVASVWCPQAPVYQEDSELKPDTLQVSKEQSPEFKPEKDELEIKRSNYRKAMAFFTTSIDENKEQGVDRYERSKSTSNRTSYIEEEAEQWDWEAVNEALQKEDTVVHRQETNTGAEEKTVVKADTEESCATGVSMEPTMRRSSNCLPDLQVNKFNEERKISVKDRISAFETGVVEKSAIDSRKSSIKTQSLSVDSNTRQSSLSRNSSTQRSESEMDEDDSGVTDMNKQLSETDTESESFPELRKMSSYQRAATHSRLFKLLQEDPDVADGNAISDDCQFKPSRKKIVHNVSITRKQNPTALADAETMSQRRERLSLPLRKNTSIDNDNPSTPNSPVSPIMGNSANNSSVVSDKLVSELVQSLLLKSDSTHFRNLPMEKLQAAAKRVLEEELDSLENTSVESTPALTPSEMKKDKSYADYYNTWSDALGADDIVPSKSFRALQDSRRSPWTARCPRVLSSKTINRDLARVTESPEISMHNRQSRECSIGKWKK